MEMKKKLFDILDQREVFWKDLSNCGFKRETKTLFSSSDVHCVEVLDCVNQIVPEMMNLELVGPITEEEVRKAVFDMHPDKSSGPDGMTPAFYQKCWPIMKADVVAYVQRFLEYGVLEETCAAANVVLISKKKCLDSMKDLRPIALCNVIYKVIMKVMANQMKPFMDTIIAESQSTFIPGRLISDNVLISFEVLHYLKWKRLGKTSFMALKIDMSKAYDRIEWSFVEAILRRMGFLERWVKLIMSCVASATYTVIHGNHEIGPVVPTRGIRQVANGAPRVSHMLFADDSYLYCKATVDEARRILELLQNFERASGQQVNFVKSLIFFSTNAEPNVRNQLCSLLGMNAAIEDSFYLGLPSTMTRNKTAVLGYLKTKVRKRLQSWEGRFLSRVGKEVLVKAVVQSLPSYAMSVFLLPLDITRDIEKLMNKFWWQSKGDRKGVHWMEARLENFDKAKLTCFEGFKARYFPHGSGCSIPDLGEPWLNDDNNPMVESDHPALTVKSAYSTLQKLKGRWFEDEASQFWRKLWSLKLPPIVSNLVWRVGANCLPTLTQLRVKRAIWGARNNFVWNRKEVRPDNIVAFAKTYLHQWLDARKNDTTQAGFQLTVGNGQWVSNDVNSVRINVDATIFDGGRSYGLGMIIRDINDMLI
uniref:Reverse transcriptase domain-containing protein n=1 Tax=Cannabis sativa TaxID=3483 RepID=A0A803PCN2_CANSA